MEELITPNSNLNTMHQEDLRILKDNLELLEKLIGNYSIMKEGKATQKRMSIIHSSITNIKIVKEQDMDHLLGTLTLSEAIKRTEVKMDRNINKVNSPQKSFRLTTESRREKVD
jgi:hypothetical protein